MNKYIRVKVSGKNSNYFINKLISKNILYSNLCIFSKYIEFDLDRENYHKLLDIKTSYDISIVSYLGIYKYLFFIIRYVYIFLFIILGVCINIFLSRIIFSVEVVHSNSKIRELIYNDLERYGIKKYSFKVSYSDKEKIVDKILSLEKNDIEWLEIEEVGCKYIVKVEQRKINSLDDECNFRHIISKKDAMITSIFSSSGEVVKKKYDYVKKGEVLISGFIYNKDKIMAKRCSVGKVLGEVWYKVNLEVPKVYIEEKFTGRKSKRLEFIFLNSNFNKYNNYKVKRIGIFNSKLLNIGLFFSTYLETDIIQKKYDLLSHDEEYFSIAISRLKDRLGDDIRVISKNVLKKEEKKGKIIVEVFIKVEEDITDYLDITNIEINNEE